MWGSLVGMWNKTGKTCRATALAAIMVSLATAVLLGDGCVSNLFYYPDRNVYDSPERYGLKYEDVYFKSKDGTMLHGWFIPASASPIGTIIHFHGNAQNLTAHFGFIAWLPKENFNVFTFDYRGYGSSDGRPDRDGIYEDCKAAIEYVRSRGDVDRMRLLVFGQSLGGANALAVVGGSHFEGIRAVAAESSFFSYRGIVSDKLAEIPILSLFKRPLSFLLVGDEYSPGDVINRISPIPVLLIHGTSDRIVPCRHSLLLFDRAREPKQLWTIEGAAHTEAFTRFGARYQTKLVSFFKDALQND